MLRGPVMDPIFSLILCTVGAAIVVAICWQTFFAKYRAYRERVLAGF